MSPEAPTYADRPIWRRIQAFLPERWRTTPGVDEPVEESWDWNGCQIHLDRVDVPNSPATVVLLHGGGGCGRLLSPYGKALRSLGYSSVAPDLPGYGLSRSSPEMVDLRRWVDCAVDLVDEERRRTGKPVVLLGLSVGGMVAYLAAAKGTNAAGVIATCLIDPRLAIVQDQLARFPWVNRALMPLLPAVAAVVGGIKVPIAWFVNMGAIANNPALVELLRGDPTSAGNRVSLRFLDSFMRLRPSIEPEAFDVCPVLLAQPGADRWTTLAASQPFFDRIAGPKRLAVLKGSGHYPLEEPGASELEKVVGEFLADVVANDMDRR